MNLTFRSYSGQYNNISSVWEGSDGQIKFEAWWEHTQGRILAGTIAIILAIGSMIYSDMKQDIENLESRVSFLTIDKVSKEEFRIEMTQLRLQNEAIKSDIIARQDALKGGDILQRMDMMMDYIRGK